MTAEKNFDTTSLREAAQMALDALEHARNWFDEGDPLPACVTDGDNAIKALLAALALPDAEPVILERVRYHAWPADPETDTPADYDLYPADVECETCIDALIVRADSWLAAPQPTEAKAAA